MAVSEGSPDDEPVAITSSVFSGVATLGASSAQPMSKMREVVRQTRFMVNGEVEKGDE